MGVIWNWLRALVGIEPEEAKALTDQFFATLRAYASAIPANANPPAGRARLQELLDKGPFEWPTAYEIEQLMTHYYDPVTLQMELGRRVLESENVLPEGHKGWYEEQHKKATNEKTTSEIVQRALLLRLINDLQWR